MFSRAAVRERAVLASEVKSNCCAAAAAAAAAMDNKTAASCGSVWPTIDVNGALEGPLFC